MVNKSHFFLLVFTLKRVPRAAVSGSFYELHTLDVNKRSHREGNAAMLSLLQCDY